MMKDAPLKERLYKHFSAQGWYALVEVPVYNPAGVAGSKYLVTDIDVLALRPSGDLRWEVVIGDCKTKRNESPANRALWVRALMEQFDATRGILLVKRDSRPVESDHRLLAQANRVALLDEKDFDIYDRAMLYPSGSAAFSESAAALASIRQVVPTRFPRLSSLSEFISSAAWNERDHYMVLRASLGAGFDVRAEIDPAKPEHLAFALEAAGVFAVALATCVGDVFHQYLQPSDRNSLEQALRVLVWGGRAKYEQASRLWRELAEARNVPEDRRASVPFPDWDAFLELVRNMLDAPHLAFLIPQTLRSAALALVEGRAWSFKGAKTDGMLLRLSLLVASFYVQASRFPQDTRAKLREHFIPAMSAAAAESVKGNEHPNSRKSKDEGASASSEIASSRAPDIETAGTDRTEISQHDDMPQTTLPGIVRSRLTKMSPG